MPLRRSLIFGSRLSVFLIGIAVGTIGTILALNLFFRERRNRQHGPS
jgi:hypothetical protein